MVAAQVSDKRASPDGEHGGVTEPMCIPVGLGSRLVVGWGWGEGWGGEAGLAWPEVEHLVDQG